MDKVSKILVAELRAGTIGRISLETPAMIERELVELAVVRERERSEEKSQEAKMERTKSDLIITKPGLCLLTGILSTKRIFYNLANSSAFLALYSASVNMPLSFRLANFSIAPKISAS